MGDKTTVTAAAMGSAAKENLPPQVSKRTISVSTLFNQVDRIRKQNEEAGRDPLAPRPAGISKSKTAKQKAPKHPFYAAFKETVVQYDHDAQDCHSDELEPVYQALVARIDGKDEDGRALNIPGIPTQADIQSLVATDEIISRPIEDEVLTVDVHLKNGRVETRKIRLGDSLAKFEAFSEKRQAELDDLRAELAAKNAELVTAQKDAIQAEDTDVKRAKNELDAQLDAFKDIALKNKQQTEFDVKKALKEDKEEKKKWEEQLNQLYSIM